jgi:hypothetical protein
MLIYTINRQILPDITIPLQVLSMPEPWIAPLPTSEITIPQMEAYIAGVDPMLQPLAFTGCADLQFESIVKIMTVEEERAYANAVYLQSVGYKPHG